MGQSIKKHAKTSKTESVGRFKPAKRRSSPSCFGLRKKHTMGAPQSIKWNEKASKPLLDLKGIESRMHPDAWMESLRSVEKHSTSKLSEIPSTSWGTELERWQPPVRNYSADSDYYSIIESDEFRQSSTTESRRRRLNFAIFADSNYFSSASDEQDLNARSSGTSSSSTQRTVIPIYNELMISQGMRNYQNLTEAGADINKTDKDGKTALFYAVNNEEVTHVLIEAGADINITDKDGKTALFYAVDNEEVTNALIEAGADVNITDKDGTTVLLHVIQTNKKTFLRLIKLLLANGASLCETTSEEDSVFQFILKLYKQAFSIADRNEKRSRLLELAEILKLFSQSRKSEVAVNKRDIHLNSPLHYWAKLEMLLPNEYKENVCDGYSFENLLKEILDLLLECGVILDDINENKQTPLHMCRTWTAVKLLLDAGAEPDVKDSSGCSPLLAAAKRNPCLENDSEHFYPDVDQVPKEFWQEVLNKRLDPWTADDNGDSILSILIEKEANCLAESLIEVACELKFVHSDTIGVALLITVCRDKSMEKGSSWKVKLVKTLLRYRNSLAQKSLSTKDTALHFSFRNMLKLPEEKVKTSVHWTIAQHLILCGADVEFADKEGKSCLDIAKSCPVLKDLVSMPVINEVPPLIDSWKAVSERHQDQLVKVSRGFKCQQMETVYYFKESLDSGTFGLVFVGINVHDGKEVAVKRVETLRVDKEKITKEIEDLKKLVKSCNKVIQCLLCTNDKDFLYVILELMEGNLDDLLCEEYNFGIINQQTELCRDICTGLDYLHNHDIIHRCIKPSNVLYKVLHSEIHLKLAFFGLRSQMCKEQHTSAFTDTYESLTKERCWIAQEVLQSQSHSKSSDVFSCGLVIHYLLSNKKHPFAPGGSSKESPLAVSIETVDNIAQHKIGLEGTISSDAIDLLQGMLDHDTTKRISISNALEHRFFQSKSGNVYQ